MGNKFYCEVCNKVVPHISSVKEHIKSKRHHLLKKNPEAEIKKPVGMYIAGDVVLDKKVLVLKAEWHTLSGNKCILCDVEVTDMEQHIALEDHMVGLIQTETCYADNRYYRKINEESYHCFSCKAVYSPFDMAKHWSDCVNTDEITVQRFKEPKSIKDIEEVMNRIALKAKAEKEIFQTFEEYYLMDHDNHVCICRFCYSSLPIDYKFKTMLQHLKTHILNQWSRNADSSSDESISGDSRPSKFVIDHGKLRAKCAAYGRSHFIKLNHNGSKGYCYLCDKYLTLSKTSFKQHCRGLIHQGHRELIGFKKSTERTNAEYTSQTIQTFMTRMQFAPENRSVLINGEMFINMYGFFFLQPIKNNPHWMKTKCYCCNIVITQGTEREHCMTVEHKDNFLGAKVIMKRGELIREIRPNLFHCAFCNVTLPYTNVLERHLQSKNHKFSRVKDIPILGLLTYWRDLDLAQASAVNDVNLYIELLHSFYEEFVN